MAPGGGLNVVLRVPVTVVNDDRVGGGEVDAPDTGTSVAIVRVDVANVRAGPGTAYPVTGELKKNQVCPITGRNADNSWWQIDCANGVSGWISDSVVRGAVAGQEATVVTGDAVTVTVKRDTLDSIGSQTIGDGMSVAFPSTMGDSGST